jgi:hypothetical protein
VRWECMVRVARPDSLIIVCLLMLEVSPVSFLKETHVTRSLAL